MPRRRGNHDSQIQRTMPGFDHELALQAKGFRQIAGIDEAGRGAWAGPVVAAAVVLPLTLKCRDSLLGVNDSKKLSSRRRDEFRDSILHVCTAYAIGMASNHEIDELGIVPATRLAMQRAVNQLMRMPDALVIDAVKLPDVDVMQDVFFYADSISLSVAAASILAKTERDQIMRRLDDSVPGYGFNRHKGYGTRMHQQALSQIGVSTHHRLSYAPIKRLLLPP